MLNKNTSLLLTLVLVIGMIILISHNETKVVKSKYNIGGLLIECNSCTSLIILVVNEDEINSLSWEGRVTKVAEMKIEIKEIRRLELAELERVESERIARLAEQAELEKERLLKLKEQKKVENVVSRSTGYQSNFETTFYTASCNTGCIGITKSGHDVSNTIYYEGLRIVAAPPNIKLYTKLRITLEDGTKIDAIVLDRGGDIKHKRLDILVSSKEEAYRLGRQQVKVEIFN